jgi:hypothetical protein
LGKPDKAKRRILFLGDSVTRRFFLLEALKKEYSSLKLEALSAGVEGYNLIQEILFFEKFNRHETFSEVVLTVHNNDFYHIPLVYRAGEKLFFYVYGEPLFLVDPWWLENSFLYRRMIQHRVQSMANRAFASQALIQKTEESLVWLKDELQRRQIPLKVILLPVLRPLPGWRNYELNSRQTAIEMLLRLQLDFEDLWPLLEPKISKEGIDRFRENSVDPWHPSAKAAEIFAAHLKKQKFLER